MQYEITLGDYSMIPDAIWDNRLYLYGVLCFIIAIVFACLATYKKKKCTATVDATIVRIRAKSSRYSYVYLPICEYYINGVKYSQTGPPHRDNVLAVGSTIPIAYNPSNPRCAYIPGRDDRVYKLRVVTFSVAGVALIIAGYVRSLISL